MWVQTWARWETDARALGLTFAPAPEYHVFPTRERPLTPYEAVARATVTTRELVASAAPDVVVADILTLAPALAAELEGVPWATSIPHLDPRTPAGWPPFSVGARRPRSAAGRRMWRLAGPLVGHGLALGRDELNATRATLGLPGLPWVHGGISRTLCLVGTLPQLEYPRPADDRTATHVVGPLQWQPAAPATPLPPGDEPLVLVAPSTSQDPAGHMLQAALDGLAALPVRVLASSNGVTPRRVPANAVLVDWADYAAVMPACDVVVCHAGHGTLVRALTSGAVVVACPVAGDMNENAARVDWAGCGVRLPRRLIGARAIRLAVLRALHAPSLRARAREIAAWAARHDAGAHAAELVEDLAAGRRPGPGG